MENFRCCQCVLERLKSQQRLLKLPPGWQEFDFEVPRLKIARLDASSLEQPNELVHCSALCGVDFEN